MFVKICYINEEVFFERLVLSKFRFRFFYCISRISLFITKSQQHQVTVYNSPYSRWNKKTIHVTKPEFRKRWDSRICE